MIHSLHIFRFIVFFVCFFASSSSAAAAVVVVEHCVSFGKIGFQHVVFVVLTLFIQANAWVWTCNMEHGKRNLCHEPIFFRKCAFQPSFIVPLPFGSRFVHIHSLNMCVFFYCRCFRVARHFTFISLWPRVYLSLRKHTHPIPPCTHTPCEMVIEPTEALQKCKIYERRPFKTAAKIEKLKSAHAKKTKSEPDHWTGARPENAATSKQTNRCTHKSVIKLISVSLGSYRERFLWLRAHNYYIMCAIAIARFNLLNWPIFSRTFDRLSPSKRKHMHSHTNTHTF